MKLLSPGRLGSAAGLVLLASPAFADQACIDSWAKDIQPIVNRCVACHQNAAPAGKLSLQKGTAPMNLIWVKADEADLPYVTPGDPTKSYIWHKLMGTQKDVGGIGAKMPLGGQLGQTEIDTIAAWITSCNEPAPDTAISAEASSQPAQ
ncbi:MAG TPA: c-type cytochrome domain-containing protein [Devosia sp.]|nr:c-type cytochrome domain-containing protein [Devosia sp.]